MNRKPILSSTPRKRFPESRPSIRQSPHTLESNNYSDIRMENSNQAVGSLSKTSPRNRKSKSPNLPKRHRKLVANSASEEEDDTNTSDEEQEEEDAGHDLKTTVTKDKSPRSDTMHDRSAPVVKANTQNASVLILSIFVVIFGCVCGIIQLTTVQDPNSITIEEIKSRFPQQNDEFWLTISNGIDEVIYFNRPATFIFLYEEKTESILDNLLKSLSSYISCKLSECVQTPIILTDGELNQPHVINNYGSLIEKYRPLLEQKGLMIVKHLENISGVSAQIFHSMCDEYTPLVPKSLFIFTMKVDRMPENSEDFLEKYLINKWNVLDHDIFYPLFTRITSMPLKIVSQN